MIEARRAIEDPSLFPPPPTDRNLAEGYRYFLGHLARIIEAETQQLESTAEADAADVSNRDVAALERAEVMRALRDGGPSYGKR